MDGRINITSAISDYDESTFASDHVQAAFASSLNQSAFASSYNQSATASSYDQQEVSQREELNEKTEFERNFEMVKPLSSGASGVTGIYKYLGSDPDILPLLNDKKELVIKSMHGASGVAATNAFTNEVFNIENVLANHNQQNGNLFPKIASVNMDDMNYILVERICVDKENTTSKSLNPYLMAMGANAAYSGLSQEQQSAHLGSIFKGMLDAQNQLHDLGLLHLDSALRNFMIGQNNSVRVIDFGLTLPLDIVNGVASKSPNKMIFPHYACNQAALNKKNPVYSLHTDAFALRVASMEAMASYLGVQEGEPMNLAIHLQGLHVRFPGKQPLFLSLHRKDNLDSPEFLAKLKEISEQNYNQPIFIKHNGKVHIFANNNPANVNRAEDWKITEVCKTNDPGVKNYPFSDNQIRLVKCSGMPKLEDMKKLGGGNAPVLISNPEDNKLWVLRYSKSGNDWQLHEIKSDDLKKYINKKVQFPDEIYKPGSDYSGHYLPDGFVLNKIDRDVRRSLGNLFQPNPEPYKVLIPTTGYPPALIAAVENNHKTQIVSDTLALLSDSDRLARSFNNLKAYAESNSDEMKREVVLQTLRQFEPYLKAVPVAANAEAFRQADVGLFNQCHQKKPELNHERPQESHHLASLGSQFTALSEEDKTAKVVLFLIHKAKELMQNPSLSEGDKKKVADDLALLTVIQKGDPKGKYPKDELKKDLHDAGYRILKLAHPEEVAKKEKEKESETGRKSLR